MDLACLSHLVCVGRDLDPAGLTPTADFHLGLQHDRIAGGLGLLEGLFYVVGDPPRARSVCRSGRNIAFPGTRVGPLCSSSLFFLSGGQRVARKQHPVPQISTVTLGEGRPRHTSAAAPITTCTARFSGGPFPLVEGVGQPPGDPWEAARPG